MKENGELAIFPQVVAGKPWEIRGANPDAGARRCRQDDHPLQAEAERNGVLHPHHRLQRRDGVSGEKRHLHCLGCRWARQDPTAVEALLPQHGRAGLRGRQRRPGAIQRSQRRIILDYGLGRDEGRSRHCTQQQTRSTQCLLDIRGRLQAGSATDQNAPVVHPGHVCRDWRWTFGSNDRAWQDGKRLQEESEIDNTPTSRSRISFAHAPTLLTP